MSDHKYNMKKFSQWKFEQNEVPTNGQLPASTSVDAPEGVEVPETPRLANKKSSYINTSGIKPWKASKESIMNYWKGLNPSLPLYLNPVEYNHEGSTIQEDGIRVTGTKEFITTVLSRLKDFLAYENPDTKLMVAYRQSPKSFLPGNKNSYIFYLQAKRRGTD